MNKYIAIAFAFLAVWFYEASGGADFEPGENTLVVFAEPKILSEPLPPVRIASVVPARPAPLPAPAEQEVARVVPEIVEEPAEDADVARTSLELGSVQFPLIETPSAVEDAVQSNVAEVVQDLVEDIVADVVEVAPEPDLRFVDGDRVNMRGGPGTDFEIVGKLLRDDMVEVLKDNGNGWLHLRATATGQEGWMADWLVTVSN